MEFCGKNVPILPNMPKSKIGGSWRRLIASVDRASSDRAELWTQIHMSETDY